MHPVKEAFFYETPQKLPIKFQLKSFFFGFDDGIILYSTSLTKRVGLFCSVSLGWVLTLGSLLEGGLIDEGMTMRVG